MSSGDKTRTCDLWVMSPTSYQLLHPAVCYSKLKGFRCQFSSCFFNWRTKVEPWLLKNKYLCGLMEQKAFKSGFVSIVGKPNVGKSSLMNKLVGENLSIITAKPQTTRHRIMGILNGEDYQIVYSDTPGILEPRYSLQQAMMTYVKVSLEDADVILLVVELHDKYDESLFERFKTINKPIVL